MSITEKKLPEIITASLVISAHSAMLKETLQKHLKGKKKKCKLKQTI
jgi:hypothetical protein